MTDTKVRVTAIDVGPFRLRRNVNESDTFYLSVDEGEEIYLSLANLNELSVLIETGKDTLK